MSERGSLLGALPFIGFCILCMVFPPLALAFPIFVIFVIIVASQSTGKTRTPPLPPPTPRPIDRKTTYADYLQSEEWQRKRYVVLKRDHGKCVHCGKPATQVHHKKYAKYQVGREPIDWLESVCASCHAFQHGRAPVHSTPS